MKTFNFEQQVAESHRNIYTGAYHLVNDSEKALDLVQETIKKALIYKDKFMPGTNLQGWLYTIMKNIFINDYNRQVRHPVYYRDTYSDAFISAEKRVEHNRGMSNITMGEIQNALGKLDEKYSKPFMMHFEGYQYEEIAEAMQLPLGTVKTRIHKARQLLQDALRSYAVGR